MPDYFNDSDEVCKESEERIYRGVGMILNELLLRMRDERLPVEKRVSAIRLTRSFSAGNTAEGLCRVVDLRDDRMFIFGGTWFIGEYPAVTALSGYGSAVAPYVVRALATERDAFRRRLLCDVLQETVGLERAESLLESRYALPGEKGRIEQAIEEIRIRREPAPAK